MRGECGMTWLFTTHTHTRKHTHTPKHTHTYSVTPEGAPDAKWLGASGQQAGAKGGHATDRDGQQQHCEGVGWMDLPSRSRSSSRSRSRSRVGVGADGGNAAATL